MALCSPQSISVADGAATHDHGLMPDAHGVLNGQRSEIAPREQRIGCRRVVRLASAGHTGWLLDVKAHPTVATIKVASWRSTARIILHRRGSLGRDLGDGIDIRE